MQSKICFIIVFLLIGLFVSDVRADTIYLRNGRSIEGIIEKEKGDNISLNVGFGTVKFKTEEIKNIYKSTPEEIIAIRKQWERERMVEEERWQKKDEEHKEAERKKKFESKKIGFSQVNDQIVVKALLNKKVEASLLLDTGASLVLLSERVAGELKKNTKLIEGDVIKIQLADGKKVDAKLILLDTINVEGAEAESVIGAVLLDSEEDVADGVLGMSFLNKFNFQIDNTDKKIILKKMEK